MPRSHAARWVLGLLLMLAVALGLLVGLKALGVPSLIAVVVAILVAGSLERTSYARQSIDRRRRRAAG